MSTFWFGLFCHGYIIVDSYDTFTHILQDYFCRQSYDCPSSDEVDMKDYDCPSTSELKLKCMDEISVQNHKKTQTMCIILGIYFIEFTNFRKSPFALIEIIVSIPSPTTNVLGPTLAQRGPCRLHIGPTWAQRALLSGMAMWSVSVLALS